MKSDLTRSFSAVSICLERGEGDIVLLYTGRHFLN